MNIQQQIMQQTQHDAMLVSYRMMLAGQAMSGLIGPAFAMAMSAAQKERQIAPGNGDDDDPDADRIPIKMDVETLARLAIAHADAVLVLSGLAKP